MLPVSSGRTFLIASHDGPQFHLKATNKEFIIIQMNVVAQGDRPLRAWA